MTYFAGRNKYLGASDIGGALGLSPYTDQLLVWERKTGRAGEPMESGPMKRGKDMEDLIVDLAIEQYGMHVRGRQAEFLICDGPCDWEYPKEWGDWIRCHVDGVIEVAGHKSAPAAGPGILECKSPGTHMIKKYREDGLPPDYIMQMQICLMLSGCDWGRYCFLDYDEWSVHVIDVIRDDKLMAASKSHLIDFWRHVVEDTPPECGPPPVVPKTEGELVSLHTEELEAFCDEYAEAAKRRKASEVYLKEMKAKFVEKVGENRELVEVSNLLRMTYRWSSPKPKLDSEALLSWANSLAEAVAYGDDERASLMAHKYLVDPDIFTKTVAPSRSLRITGINDFKGVF